MNQIPLWDEDEVEERLTAIAQNGNNGEHYDQEVMYFFYKETKSGWRQMYFTTALTDFNIARAFKEFYDFDVTHADIEILNIEDIKHENIMLVTTVEGPSIRIKEHKYTYENTSSV